MQIIYVKQPPTSPAEIKAITSLYILLRRLKIKGAHRPIFVANDYTFCVISEL